MTMPNQRQRDPMPWSRGGEVALVAVTAVLLVFVLAALLGLGISAALFGDGWVWPHGTDTIGQVLEGLLSGRPGQGLAANDAARVPGRGAVYSCIVVCELLSIAAAIASSVLALRWVRPDDARRGMASRAEAQHVLGIRRMRGVARLIRPDLQRTTSSGGAP